MENILHSYNSRLCDYVERMTSLEKENYAKSNGYSNFSMYQKAREQLKKAFSFNDSKNLKRFN